MNFHSLGIEYILQEVLSKTKDKSITHNTFTVEDDDSIMCRFLCIAFVECRVAGKTLLDYINLLSPNNYKKNDQVIYKHFKIKHGKEDSSK